MKKASIGIIFFILALALVGCSMKNSPSSVITSISGKSEDSSSPLPTVDLQMLTEPDGSFAQSGAGNENGYYSLLYNNDGSVNILYTDYKSAQTVYLSNQISTTHKDNSDTSYFEAGISYMFLVNDKLYCVQSPPAQYSNGVAGKIFELDLNGENRKEVFKLSANEAMQRGVATDGTNIYTALESAGTTGNTTTKFCKISLTEGTKEELFELEPYNYLMGVYDDKLIFKSTDADAVTCTLYEYDITGANKRELMSWKPDELFGSVKNGKFYYFNYQAGECSALDLKTLEVSLIASNLPTTGKSNTTYLGPIFDNHLTYQTGRSEDANPNLILHDGYGIDLDTGECKLVSLPLKGHEGGQIRLLAENTDMFLATIEIKNQKVMIEGMGGEQYEETVPVLVSGLISKEDYWGSVANYINLDSAAIY